MYPYPSLVLCIVSIITKYSLKYFLNNLINYERYILVTSRKIGLKEITGAFVL